MMYIFMRVISSVLCGKLAQLACKNGHHSCFYGNSEFLIGGSRFRNLGSVVLHQEFSY